MRGMARELKRGGGGGGGKRGGGDGGREMWCEREIDPQVVVVVEVG